MAKRRGNHERSIYHRKDGLWCAQISLIMEAPNQIRQEPNQCRLWIKQMLARIDHGMTYDSTQVTLDRFVENWLNGKELARRPKTPISANCSATHPAIFGSDATARDSTCPHSKALYDQKGSGQGELARSSSSTRSSITS